MLEGENKKENSGFREMFEERMCGSERERKIGLQEGEGKVASKFRRPAFRKFSDVMRL